MREVIENQIEVNLRTFYDLKRQIENIKHDTVRRRRLTDEMVKISQKVEKLEMQLEGV